MALPAQKVGHTWLFDQDEIDRWVKNRQAGVPAKRSAANQVRGTEKNEKDVKDDR